MSIYIVRIDTAEGYSFKYTHADIREAHRRFEDIILSHETEGGAE